MRLLFCLPLTALLFAQQAQQQQQQTQAPKPGRITGKVMNALTGEPVRKATVSLQPVGAQQQTGGGPQFVMGGGMRGGMSAATDNAGAFAFENVTPGAYRITGEKTGFIRSGFGGRGGGGGGGSMASRIEVASGSEKADIVVRMTPQGIVSGRIVDEDGEPMEGVNVSLVAPTYFQGQRRFTMQGGSQTNDRGEFRINNVPPGKFYVQVVRMSMGGGPIQQGAAEFGYPRAYFPGVETLEQAQRVEVGPGQEFSGVQMTLRRTRVFRVKGQVAGVAAPAQQDAAANRGRRGGNGMMVQLRPEGSEQIGMGFGPPGMGGGGGASPVQADGTFEIAGVAPGAYRAVVNSFGEGRPRVVGTASVSVGSNNVEGVVVSPSPIVTFSGKVTVEGDATQVNLKQVRVSVQSQTGFNPPVEVAEDGTFLVKDLSPERYMINVAQLTTAYVKSINVGGQEVRDKGLDLNVGGGGPIQIILSTKIAKVTGTVEKQRQEDGPGSVIIARVLPDNSLTLLSLNARVEDSGSFTFANVPPGDYKFFAVEELDMNQMSDPDFLKKFEDRATSVKIGEGDSKSVSIKQIRFAETSALAQ